MTHEEVLAQMTGPGGPFELVVENVRGLPMKNFASRQRSLREKIDAVGNFAEREFLVQGARRITYGEFRRLVWGTAARLKALGLRRGDRLAILAYNSVDWVITLFGATSIGGIVVGLNGWWVQNEIAYGLTDSGSRFLVVDDRLFPRVRPLIGEIPTLERVFYIGSNPPAGTQPVGDLVCAGDEAPTDPVDEDDPFVILYTSGTTGRPKGCITTHRGTIAQVQGIIAHGMIGAMLGGASPLPTDGSQPAGLITSPLFHVAGLHTGLCTAMTAGAKIVFTEGRVDPERVLALIERERITAWGAVPTVLHRVVNSPELDKYDLSSLTRISVGGAPAAPETLARARVALPVEPSLASVYGMTETHGVIMMNGGEDLRTHATSVGHPLPYFDVKIVGGDGQEVPEGTLGEFLLYGPTVTPGYWNNPEATAAAIRDGWLYTGDVGYRDADGLYYLVDRTKDIIIRGGENVYSVEIENCLAEHPQIDEAAVIGVPDPELGERVKAIVCPVRGATLTVEEVRAHVAGRLASFKVPEIIEITERPLPRNPAGKILKNQLRGGGGGGYFADDALE
jgi:long-chain acyl-CoA synthetase